MVFGAEPETIDGLKYAGFDVVSLANNHFGDQGVAGMNFTFSHLNKNEIEFIGAGENESQAREPKVIERNGVKFAFLGYNDVKSAIQKGYMATSEKPGVAVLTKDNLMEDIKRAKERAQVVIVSIHWGIEYETSPT
jgi:poly-gamma-glutamate synthesis protein (capsule biosynthesis protein)